MKSFILLCLLGIGLTVFGFLFLTNDIVATSGIDHVVNLNDGAGVKGQ